MHAKAHWIIIFGCSPRLYCDAPKDIDIFRLYLISCVRMSTRDVCVCVVLQTIRQWQYHPIYLLQCTSIATVYRIRVNAHSDQYVSMAEIPFVCTEKFYTYIVSPHKTNQSLSSGMPLAHKMSIIFILYCNVYKYTSPFQACFSLQFGCKAGPLPALAVIIMPIHNGTHCSGRCRKTKFRKQISIFFFGGTMIVYSLFFWLPAGSHRHVDLVIRPVSKMYRRVHCLQENTLST